MPPVVSLADNVARWLGRVELVARGAQADRREAERCLASDRPIEARLHAHALLAKVPGSPIGLALLVEACEQASQPSEALEALRELCASAPWRGELWVRLGEALEGVGAPAQEQAAAVQHALEPEMDRTARRRALLKLADLDLAAGDPLRANRWLDGLRLAATSPDVALRALEVALALGDQSGVQSALGDLGTPDVLDGRATLAAGRAGLMLGQPEALDQLLRAFILDAPFAASSLAGYVARCRDAVHVARVREVLQAADRVDEPGFALALALAEGRADDAHGALLRIARSGDRQAARSLYDIALERWDAAALATAVEVLAQAAPAEGRALLEAQAGLDQGQAETTLAQLQKLVQADAQARSWAHAMSVQILRSWVQAPQPELFSKILAELRRAAASLDRLDLMTRCETLSIERERPLRVAVVGEFNAGKSTFINALIGADVAPTGILPTTASLHWLSWSPDPFVRVVLADGPDRVVSHEALKATLREIYEQSGCLPREVHICAPIERLRRIELLDTPGFNAPQAEHALAAQRGVAEAHVALWILDAAQPLKDTERAMLQDIGREGVPVQVLVNKSDRLEPGQLPLVLEHAERGLMALGVRSLGPVLGLSAREALAGRLGDERALESSGWSGVEQMLSSTIVNRSQQLRQAAVRRKAHTLATELVAAAKQAQEPPAEALHSEHSDRLRAERLGGLDREACERILAELAVPLQLLIDDLRPLRVASVSADETSARAYAEARLGTHLADPITQALLRVAELGPQWAERLRGAVVQVLRGAAAVDATHGIGWRVVHACALAARESIVTASSSAQRASGAQARLARLEALREALG